MAALMPTRIAVLGLGEAGGEIARDLVAAGADVVGFDPLVPAPEGVEPRRDDADAVRDATLVLSVNSAHDAVPALEAALPALTAGAIWADLNTAAPAVKAALTDRLAGRDVAVVDVALMAPVPGKGVRTPMLVSGAAADRYADILTQFGADVTVQPGPAGAAISRKLLRSVFYKGLAAAVVEASAAAEAAGCGSWLRDNISAELTGFDEHTIERLLDGTHRHARRRVDEMAAACTQLRDLGVEPRIATAAHDLLVELRDRERSLRSEPSDQETDVIIDCHGHYTTAPAAHTSWREAQQAAFGTGQTPPPYPDIQDDALRESIEDGQLRLMRERGVDLTLFSPRASAMGHHVGDEATSTAWTRACNDLIARVVSLYPDNFAGVCQLPQSPGAPISGTVGELRRCVEELGFVGCNLNPDPSGGHWTSPPLTDRYWYPLYEAMAELDVPAMVHVSAVTNPNFHATGSHYLNADTTAFMQLLQADLFTDFPGLRLIIPHGGGAVPYHWGRFRGLTDMLGRPALSESVMRNVFFDTCVYHQPGIDLLFDVIDIDNILFGSEMIGAVRGIDPQTGHPFDHTRRYVDALPLSPADRHKVYEANARRVYPRLKSRVPA